MREQTSHMVGKTFGSLTVTGYEGKSVSAVCICGSSRAYEAREMRRGRIVSCGCKPQALTARHPKVFRAWWGAKQRCHNLNDSNYWRYGLAGVSVFEGWRDNFQAFFDYIGEPPSPEHSLDRFPDPFGNYEPGNVRWATREEQARNQRKNHLVWASGMAAIEIRKLSMAKASKKYHAKKEAMK